jgi:hypothetical protein
LEVLRYKIHPGYSVARFENDIAIITLKTKVSFTESISPVCLPAPGRSSSHATFQSFFRAKIKILEVQSSLESDLFDGALAHVAGWGSTTYGGPSSQELMEIRLKVFIIIIKTSKNI